jgi:hypothetical protein
LQKDFEKNFQNNLQTQNKWCKCGPKCKLEENIHAYLMKCILV